MNLRHPHQSLLKSLTHRSSCWSLFGALRFLIWLPAYDGDDEASSTPTLGGDWRLLTMSIDFEGIVENQRPPEGLIA